ncbi:uncharacterized protein LOC142758985 [Rhinoderma darwinii]|uniref:uncharacterized protein LOC142758985 n=1 Tax=Rhinoderma darwinii TaxID=43563 RepID=UPI003F669154
MMVDRVVSGTIEANGRILSIYQSVVEGLVDYETGVLLLEMQLIVSGLVCPRLKRCFDIEDAKSHNLIDDQIQVRLHEISHAKSVIFSLPPSDFPIITAFNQELISETVTVKMITTLLSCGCLQLATTGEQLNVNKLFQRNVISTLMFTKLIERQKMAKDLIDPITADKMTLADLFQRTVTDGKTGMRFLLVNAEDKGKITLKSGRKLSVLRAAHEGILEREIMYRLLGAQLFSGGIIHPDTGSQLTLEQSRDHGVIDHGTVCGILTQQVQNGGILCPSTRKCLTVDEAVQCNLISYSSALMVLEAQRGFIGLIWPDTSEIFPISTALQQGMISNELAQRILSNRHKIAGLYIPETSEIVQLDIAAESGIIEKNTASVLSTLKLQDKMPNIDVLEPTCKHTLKWISSYESHTAQSAECSENKSEEELTHNPEHTKQLFISYLMINSYIDANTGERLLLFDGDLDEVASMLLESEHIVRTSCENKEDVTDIVEDLEMNLNTDNNISECKSTSHLNSSFEETESLKTATEKLQFNDKFNCKDPEEVICQIFKNVEADDISSEDKLQRNESTGTCEVIDSFPVKDVIIADVQLGKQSNTIIAVDKNFNNSIQENNVENNFNKGSHHTGEVYNSLEEILTTSNISISESNTEDHVVSVGEVPFCDQLQQVVAEQHCDKGTDSDGYAIPPYETYSDVLPNVGQDIPIELHGYLQNSSSSDLSDGDVDSEDEVGDMDDSKKTWKTIGNGIIEDRTPTQSDTSSDEDTYDYTDSDPENTDNLQGRQYLETIIEEDSESNSCLDDQTSLYKEKYSLPNSSVEEEYESSKYKSVEKDMAGNMNLDDKVIIEEELDEEYVESSFSETDIDCFVTDEANSEEGYQATEEYSDEYVEDNDIDSKAVLFDFGYNAERGFHIENILYPHSNNSGNTSKIEVLSVSDNRLHCLRDMHSGESDIPNLDNAKASLREEDTLDEEISEPKQTKINSADDKSDVKCLQCEIENNSKTKSQESINLKYNSTKAQLDADDVPKLHNGLEYTKDNNSDSNQDTDHSHSRVDSTNLNHENIRAEKEDASGECSNANLKAVDNETSGQVEDGQQSNVQCDTPVMKHPTIEWSMLHTKHDSESKNYLDLDSEQMLEKHSPDEVKAVFDTTVTDIENHYHIEDKETHCKTLQQVNSDLPDDSTSSRKECPSSLETNDTGICRITDILNKKEGSSNHRESVFQLTAKSPIHMDNLSAIFDSSTSKSDSNNIEVTTTSALSETEQRSDALDMKPINTEEMDNLTTYLKGCAGMIQTADPYVYPKHGVLADTNSSCGTEENLDGGEKMEHSTKNLTEDHNNSLDLVNREDKIRNLTEDILVKEGDHVFTNIENTQYVSNFDLVGVKSKAEENEFMIQGDNKQDKHVEHDTRSCNMEMTQNHKKASSTSSSFSDQKVLKPNPLTLISSQLDQIFHVPPESENSNKFEEFIINKNKGLFPSELIPSSSIPDQMNKQISEQNDTFSPGYSPEQPGNARKFSFTEQQDNDVKSLDENFTTQFISLSTESEVEQNAGGKVADKVTLTLNKCCQTLQEHLTVVQDQKLHLDNLPPLGDNLETLKIQLEQLESFESRLAAFSVTLRKDVQFSEQFLSSVPGDLPGEHLKELSEDLMKTSAAVCAMSSDRAKQIAFAVDAEMSKLAETHRVLLNQLQVLADWITASNETLDFSVSSNDVAVVKQTMQSLKTLSNNVSEQKAELETTAFDVQFFISEHAQDLSPNQSKQLLRSLNATQKSFQNAQKRIASHMESLKSHLLAAQDLDEQKV